MSIGKYSPTVSSAYAKDQGWWERNGGEDPVNKDKPYAIYCFDRDGYDSYGYNIDGIDRAGNAEDDYLGAGEWVGDDNEEYVNTLYEEAEGDWGVDDNGFPGRR